MSHLTKDDAEVLATSLTSDLSYYDLGLRHLEELKNSSNEDEFKELLKAYDYPTSWTMDDVVVRYENTKNLMRIINIVITDIQEQC